MKIVKAKIKPITRINGNKMLLEIANIARTCYKTPKSNDIEAAKRTVQRLIQSGHTSMLEFVHITMKYVSNIAAYKDLTRQRLTTFAIESTRYANYSKDKFGNELTFINPIEIKDKTSKEYEIWKQTMKILEQSYMDLAKLGKKPDVLSLILPHSTKAEFNISANLREWRHIFKLRSSIAATGTPRPCVAEIMDPTLELFYSKIPVIFDDLFEIYKQKKQQIH